MQLIFQIHLFKKKVLINQYFRILTIAALTWAEWAMALPCANAGAIDPASRGLPLFIFNDDGGDLNAPAFGHSDIWVPAGPRPVVQPVRSVQDCLSYRIAPLMPTPVRGLSYCGNFGTLAWDLPQGCITALGPDPLLPVVDYWRQNRRSFFFSMRMNDYHHAWSNSSDLWTAFRRNHHQWFLNAPSEDVWREKFLPWIEGREPRPLFRAEELAYNYALPEVRNYYLEILRNACQHYDIDGVELDWLRYPSLFRAGEVNAEAINTFVGKARAILDESGKRRGHPLRLVCRVPDSPDKACVIGLDVETWLKEGWLDAIMAGHGITFSAVEIEKWVALAHHYKIPVYGVLDRMTHGEKSFARFGSAETLRAAAAILWQKGVDGLYYFNYYIRGEYSLLGELSDRARLARLGKEYFLDSNFGEAFNGTMCSGPLPIAMASGTVTNASLFIADAPENAGSFHLDLVLQVKEGFEPPEISLNGYALKDLQMKRGKTCVVSISSPELKRVLKLGPNKVAFSPSGPATLTALSLKVIP